VTLRLNAITSYKTALVSWINPLDGTKTQIGRYPISARVSLTPPGDWHDAVLLAEPSFDQADRGAPFVPVR